MLLGGPLFKRGGGGGGRHSSNKKDAVVDLKHSKRSCMSVGGLVGWIDGSYPKDKCFNGLKCLRTNCECSKGCDCWRPILRYSG